MATFLTLAFSFPTVVFTTLLLVMVGYWLLVLVGAFGFDFHADGALDAKGGALEAKFGALEAKAAAIEAKAGVLDGALDAKAGALDAIDAKTGAIEAKSGLMEMLGFGVVPATVSITVILFWSWVLSMLGSAVLGPVLGGWMPVGAAWAIVGLFAFMLSLAFSIVSVKPLKPIFTMTLAPRRRQLLGKVASVSSGRVDATFGQATMEDGGAGLILPVFCAKANELKKGDRVLLLEFNEETQAYEVEPVDWLVPEELKQLDNPLAAEAVARAHVKQRLG